MTADMHGEIDQNGGGGQCANFENNIECTRPV